MCRTKRAVDAPKVAEISPRLGAGRQQGLPCLMDDGHSISCRHSYPKQAAFMTLHTSVRCSYYRYQFNLYVKTQSVSFALQEIWQKKKWQMGGGMFPSCGVDHRKSDSWSILVFWAEIMGKECLAEAPFILFFRIACHRWNQAVRGQLLMKYTSSSIREGRGFWWWRVYTWVGLGIGWSF